VHNVPLLDAIASASLPKIPEFGTQSIANSAWSFATLFFLNVPLMEALSSEFIKKIGEMESQNLSNMAWAMATLVLPNKPLMEAISAQARTKFDSFMTETHSIHDTCEYINYLLSLAWSLAMSMHMTPDISDPMR
jgi:hypothetical protein